MMFLALVGWAFLTSNAISQAACNDDGCQEDMDMSNLLQSGSAKTKKAVAVEDGLDHGRNKLVTLSPEAHEFSEQLPVVTLAPSKARAASVDNHAVSGSASKVFHASLMQASVGLPPVDQGVCHSVAGICAFVMASLSFLWGCYAIVLAVGKGSRFLRLSLLCLSFSATCWCMTVLNKALVDAFHAPCLVTGVQMMMAAIGCVILTPDALSFDPRLALHWCLVPFSFFGMCVSSFFTYQYLTLSMLMVIRNVAPLVTLPIEKVAMPVHKQPHISMQICAALALQPVAILIYTDGMSTSLIGVAIAFLNMLLTIMYRVVQRRLLIAEAQGLSTQTCLLLNNSLGCIPTAVLGWHLGEHYHFDATLWFHSSVTPLLILSGIIGSGLSYFTIVVQREITAVSVMVLSFSERLAVVVVGVAIFNDTLTSNRQVLGLILSFVGVIAYTSTQLLSRSEEQLQLEPEAEPAAAEADPENRQPVEKGS